METTLQHRHRRQASRDSGVAFLWSCLAALALTSCAAGIGVSPSGGTHASPVTVTVSSSADIQIGSLRATVDGVDQTAAFNYDSPGTKSLSARLTLAPGMHTVQATANVWNGYDRRYDPKSAQATFEAGAPGSLALSISPTAVAVVPGASATINLQIVRGGSFTGEVRIGEFDPLYGTGNTTTISIFDSTGTIASAARSDSWAGQRQRTIAARGTLFNGSVAADQPLVFRVAHKPGPIARATLPGRSAGFSLTGPDNKTTLNVDNGPPNAPRFEARFRSPTNSIGATVGFDPGTPATGGAGFCPDGSVGYVISGGSTTTPHTLTLVLFDDVFAKQSYAIPANAPNGPVVTPEVFFSRDCAVVVMVGADTQTQRNFRARVRDWHQARDLCSFAFDAAPTTLQAEVRPPAADNQELRFAVGGQTPPCTVF